MGYQVFAGVRNDRDAEALREGSSAYLVPLYLDVTELDSIREAAQTITETIGDQALIGLVNNAGIASGGPLEFLPIPVMRQQLEVNVIGQLAVTQASLPLLRKSRGRIVNMGSIAGLFCSPFQAPYAMSKFALEAMTDGLRNELRPWGIHVSIIQPGNIATPIWKKSLQAYDQISFEMPPQLYEYYGPVIEKMRNYISKKEPKVQPEVVAQAVYHALTSKRPKSRYLIGEDAKALKRISGLPDRVKDWLIAKKLPKYGDELSR
jgi:NAD(P)-dependent dehydrogenase (short-subunit alcohol dehydrogenase family)